MAGNPDSNRVMNGTDTRSRADGLLGSIIRGEHPAWPGDVDGDLEGLFLQRAQYHGVSTLIFGLLRGSAAWQALPAGLQDRLTQAVRHETAWDLQRNHRTEQVLQKLGKQGVRVLLIKGAALARTLYASPGFRSRCDTDLFIQPGDIDKVQQILKAAGFEVLTPIFKRHQFSAVSNISDDSSIRLDIHWRVLNAARYARAIGFDDAWEHACATPGLAGVRTLGPPHSLLLACLHRWGNERHDRNRLIWLYDIHLLIGSMAPGQLEEFVRMALRPGLRAACADGLRSAREYLRTAMPGELAGLLEAVDPPVNFRRRYRESFLALLLDDLRYLPDAKSRMGLVREVLLPSPQSLLTQYGKVNRLWLPWLYLRQWVVGLSKKLSLQ